MDAAKKNRSELRVFVQRFGQIAPLKCQSIHRRLPPLPGLFPELDREVND
jgi:hypothetical protein